MPKLPKGKKAVTVYISEDLLEIFRKIVKDKHENMYGLSIEIEDAMKLWVKQHTHEQTLPLKINKVNPTPRIFQKWMTVRRRLEAEYRGELPHQISRFDVENAILKEIGSDKRTITKYMRLFTKVGCIKIISAGIVEVVG